VTIAAGTGTVTFAGAVGGVLALGATTITAGTLNVSDDFYTSGTTTINASSMQTAATKAFSVISDASATLNVDSLVVGAAMTGSAGGTLTIQPRTSTTTIGLGSSASGALNLDDTELAYINGKFGALIIGSSSGTGAVAVNYGSTFIYTQPLTLRTASAGSIAAVDTLNTGSNALTISSGTISLVDVVSGELAVTGASGITLNGNVTTAGSQTYTGATTLGTSVMLDTTTGLSAGRGILFAGTGTIVGTTANAQALTINTGTVGTIQVNGAIGSTATLSSLTVTHSGGARFIGAVSVDTSIVLTNTVSGAVVSFEGGLSTPVLTTTANPYGISLTGSNNSIVTSIEFVNTGSLALGNSSTDAFSFGGNLTVTAPSSLLIAGVFTAGGSITLGDAGRVLVFLVGHRLARRESTQTSI
jgi:hypothetical protein